ncbi:hypothetical protein D9M73_186350 [compost metagenome]
MDRAFEALDLGIAGIARRRLPVGKALHRVHLQAGHVAARFGFARKRRQGERRELIAGGLRLSRGADARAVHRPRDAEGWPGARSG